MGLDGLIGASIGYKWVIFGIYMGSGFCKVVCFVGDDGFVPVIFKFQRGRSSQRVIWAAGLRV